MAFLGASNDVADWGGVRVTSSDTSRFDNTRVPYAIQIENGINFSYKGPHLAPSGNVVWYHWRWRTASAFLASADGYLVEIRDINANLIAMIDVQDGKLRARALADTNAYGGFSTLSSANRYWDIDLKVEVDSSNVVVELFVNGGSVGSVSVANSSSLFGVGREFAFVTFDILTTYFSEFIIADTDTRGQRMTRLKPTSNGFHTAWAGVFTDINNDDPTDGITTETAADRESVGFATYSNGSAIGALIVNSLASKDAGAPASLKHSLRISSTDYDGATLGLPAANSCLIHAFGLDPSDSSAWDTTKINACEAGVHAIA